MDLQTSVRTCLQKYATFKGRAARSEMWWFFFATTIGIVILTAFDVAVFSGIAEEIGVFATIFSFATMIPSIAVGTRRLHDLDRSGWWQLLWFVPIVGWLVLLYFFVIKGTAGDNRFGEETNA